MTCEWLQERMIETARAVARGTPLPAETAAHLHSCDSCSQRLEAEVAMRRTFDDLAETLEQVDASAAMEQRMLLHVRRRRRKTETRVAQLLRVMNPRLAWAASIFLLAILAGAAAWHRSFSSRKLDAAHGQAASIAKVEEVEQQEFLSLQPMTDPNMMAVAQVVRVRLSRDAARNAGLSVDALDGESLDVDLLVGTDGIPRGVRFVR